MRSVDKVLRKRLLGRPDDKIRLRQSYRKRKEECELDSSGSGQHPMEDSSEHDNGSMGFIKFGNCLDKLRNY
jgi:hypothetical protein